MITIVLGAITLLFIAYASLKGWIEKIFNLKICTLCAAVATTWIMMLAMKVLGIYADKTITGILIGESVAGIMYGLSGKTKISPFVGLPAILFGTAIAYSAIEWKFDASSLFILVPIALVMAIMFAARKKTAKHDGLLKKLENCCG